MNRIFNFRMPVVVKRCLRLWVATAILTFSIGATMAQSTATIAAGSYIVDMGITPQTVGNGLKPYGLLYQLLLMKVPVMCSINPAKTKETIDFTIGAWCFKGLPLL